MATPSFSYLVRPDGFIGVCRAQAMMSVAQLHERAGAVEAAQRDVASLEAQLAAQDDADSKQSRELTAVASAKSKFEAKLLHIAGATGAAEEALLAATAERSRVEGELAASRAELLLQHERIDSLAVALVTMRESVRAVPISALRRALGAAEQRTQYGEAMLLAHEVS